MTRDPDVVGFGPVFDRLDHSDTMTIPALCKRTWAIWNSGEPIEGFYCSYAWSGQIPCTGSLRCILCGAYKPEDKAKTP